MNNQNPYQQQPQQPYQQQPYQQPYQPAPQAPMPTAPKAPKGPKAPFFNNDMLGIIGCTVSITGFGMLLLSLLVGGVYGLILNILAFVLSGGGCFLSFMIGNQRIKTGAPRGTVATLGMIFGAATFLLCIFAIFTTGCRACASCKTGVNVSSSGISINI